MQSARFASFTWYPYQLLEILLLSRPLAVRHVVAIHGNATPVRLISSRLTLQISYSMHVQRAYNLATDELFEFQKEIVLPE